MNLDNNQKEFVKEIINQLEDEKKLAQKNLNRNLDKISELNVKLKTLNDKVSDDTDIFSPRIVDNLYSVQIDSLSKEKISLEEKNRENYEAINKLSSLLNTLYSFNSEDSIYKIVNKNKNSDFNSFILLETDRQRIAKDLHDTSLQNLTAIVHKVELASMYINQDPIRAKMELSIISDSIKDTINEIRDTIFELRPMSFDDIGFKELMYSYIEKEIKKNDINIVFDKYILNTDEQPILIFIFRVIRECINNSIKHSKCSEIRLIIDDSDKKNVLIEIHDNGTGFDVDENNFEKNKHFGLIIMKERVKLMKGSINIDSNNNGTHVIIKVPN